MRSLNGSDIFFRFAKATDFFNDPAYVANFEPQEDEPKQGKSDTKPRLAATHDDHCALCGRELPTGVTVVSTSDAMSEGFTDIYRLKYATSPYTCEACAIGSVYGRGRTGMNFYVAINGDDMMYEVGWDRKWWEVPNVRPMIAVIGKNKNKHFYYLIKTSEDPRLFIAFLDDYDRKPVRQNVVGLISEGQAFHNATQEWLHTDEGTAAKRNDVFKKLTEFHDQHFQVTNRYLAAIARGVVFQNHIDAKKEAKSS